MSGSPVRDESEVEKVDEDKLAQIISNNIKAIPKPRRSRAGSMKASRSRPSPKKESLFAKAEDPQVAAEPLPKKEIFELAEDAEK
mmetsp:Transcript_20796/g.32061  ORF Transcript_20796/g.32061 Transcript_20796/m.32061 type:complete len:85 (-) Transcript_20796:626-880(-)